MDNIILITLLKYLIFLSVGELRATVSTGSSTESAFASSVESDISSEKSFHQIRKLFQMLKNICHYQTSQQRRPLLLRQGQSKVDRTEFDIRVKAFCENFKSSYET